MRITRFMLLLFIAFTSCKNEKKNSIYIGTYRSMDQLVPYPFLLNKENDSISLINNKGVILDQILKKELKANDTLKFDNHHLFLANKNDKKIIAFDLIDTISFMPLKDGSINQKSRAEFEKISPEKFINADNINNKLLNHIWKYEVIEDENSNPNKDLKIEKLFYFKKDSVFELTNYFYKEVKIISEYESKLYTVFNIENSSFISFEKEIDNPQPIFQIISNENKKIELRDYSSKKVKDISFIKENINKTDYMNLLTKANKYSNCFDGYQGEYYFNNDITYIHGNKYILNFINEDMPYTKTENGYIIIHFNVNCLANVGDFGLIQMDENFKKTLFPEKTVSHIINRVSKLKKWPSTNSTSDWLLYKDVHAFLMFKFQNGKISDICP